MVDQCKHCSYKGDIKTCESAECFQHENWYAKQKRAEIDRLKNRQTELERALRVISYKAIDKTIARCATDALEGDNNG